MAIPQMTISTLGNLVEHPDRLPNKPGSPIREAFAIYYPDYGPDDGVVVAEGTISYRAFTTQGDRFDPFEFDKDVWDFLIDNFTHHLEAHIRANEA